MNRRVHNRHISDLHEILNQNLYSGNNYPYSTSFC